MVNSWPNDLGSNHIDHCIHNALPAHSKLSLTSAYAEFSCSYNDKSCMYIPMRLSKLMLNPLCSNLRSVIFTSCNWQALSMWIQQSLWFESIQREWNKMDGLLEGGGLHSTVVAYLPLTQQPPVWFSALPRIFLLMLLIFIDGTAQNRGPRLDIANWYHPLLASGKIVLHKMDCLSTFNQAERLVFFVCCSDTNEAF